MQRRQIQITPTAVFYCLAFLEIAISQMSNLDDSVTTYEVQSIEGGMAALPCDIDPDASSDDDRLYMVLWFKQSGTKPIYRFDVRGRSFNNALRWSDPKSFGNRSYFITVGRPAALNIEGVERDDEGVYRCRVDFTNSPTRNYEARLTVVVPPHQVQLYDEAGRDVPGVVGPLQEGAYLTLYCEIRGGHPKPELKWLINQRPIKEHVIVKNDGKVIISKTTLRNAQRSWLNNTVRCQANNTRLLNPRERTARIEMHLRPTSVEIVTNPDKVLAGTEVILKCIVKGSRPVAQITWYIDNRQIPFVKHEEYSNMTTTVSLMRLLPQPKDDGATVLCRAVNTQLGAALQHAVTLAVVYKPVAVLVIGSPLNPNLIKEGDDVYFECTVKSNPVDHDISWEHNGRPLQEVVGRYFVSSKALIIRKLRRKDAGTYVCLATNVYGTSRSQMVYLRVQHRPWCAAPSPVVIGAQLHEQVRVRCSVHADPTEVQFTWQFNNTGESFQVSPARYEMTSDLSSELVYSAASERDFGLLLCRATNAVGPQGEPCVFRIVPATRPNPPRNCSAFKESHKGRRVLAVRFVAGYDGGLEQHFLLYAFNHSQRIVYNHTADLHSGDYTWMNISWSFVETVMAHEMLAVVARNAKGASEPCVLAGLRIRDSPLHDPATEGGVKTKNVSNVVASCVLITLLILIVLVFLWLVKLYKASRTPLPKHHKQAVVQVDARKRRVNAYPSTKVTQRPSQDTTVKDKPDTEPVPQRVTLESVDVTELAKEEPAPTGQESIPLTRLWTELSPSQSPPNPQPRQTCRPSYGTAPAKYFHGDL